MGVGRVLLKLNAYILYDPKIMDRLRFHPVYEEYYPRC